jgi:hypothetical protein
MPWWDPEVFGGERMVKIVGHDMFLEYIHTFQSYLFSVYLQEIVCFLMLRIQHAVNIIFVNVN